MAVGYGTDIVIKFKEEIASNENAIEQIPKLQQPVQDHIDNLVHAQKIMMNTWSKTGLLLSLVLMLVLKFLF